MHVSVADRGRTTQSDLTLLDGESAVDVLDQGLLGQNIASGQIQIICDKDFLGALRSEGPADLVDADPPWQEGHVATYRGVPIIAVN